MIENFVFFSAQALLQKPLLKQIFFLLQINQTHSTENRANFGYFFMEDKPMVKH